MGKQEARSTVEQETGKERTGQLHREELQGRRRQRRKGKRLRRSRAKVKGMSR